MSRNEDFRIPYVGPQTGVGESGGLTQWHFTDTGGRGCCIGLVHGSRVPVILMMVNT